MIFVTGFGQLCNNILQFGHVYAWGKEHNVKAIGLRFCYKYLFFHISNHRGYHFFTYLFAKYAAKARLIPKVNITGESDVTEANIRLLRHTRLIVLDGWFLRDYEAFLRRREEIKELFSFKESLRRKVDALLPPAICLGVHIRRRDYVRWMGGMYFFTDEEYIHIIRSFLRNMPAVGVQIILTTNDPSLCLSVYQKSLPSAEVHLLRGNPGEDLYALSNCRYIIGPPSTFSLMAAFYNDAPLYWIHDKTQEVTLDSFRPFDYHFRHIL